ncbi:hypothetical protein D9758_001274 [Tetrapyrgos nigripes]|uniref:SSD domain-containing protein n=1 Tax=Tetrapyrgos nigripes TaxID=182062 RepID=A0A8H5GRI8_9AGAR|nr:hypothetical protein D9758_001274 [Tetrapyrgos nigripes]
MDRLTSDDQRCAMRDACGKKGFFGRELPCPYDGPPIEPDDSTRQVLLDVCGEEFTNGPSCCTKSQVETLGENFKLVEGLIASCPACRNNFRSFFCAFTCSPNQSSFLNVTSTQTTDSNQVAVESVDFFVGEDFAKGFYNSCKDVQYGASNGFAMEFIGGGAKNYTSFLKFLGDEKPTGSPIQVNFPRTTLPEEFTPLNPSPRNCSDNDLLSRCSCIDCPSVCPILPPVDEAPVCNIGLISCFSFILILAYSLAVLGFLIGLLVQTTIRRRRERRYERVALSTETGSLSSPRIHTRGLVGAGSLAQYMDEDSLQSTVQTDGRDLGRGASLLDPVETVQPRQYKLNNYLRRFFYKLGLASASSPWLTFACVFTVVGLLNIGWKRFEVETDPVRLWVSPTSESRLQKEYFDEHFGPFYRPQQIFITSSPASEEVAASNESLSLVDGSVQAVLSWSHLKYWSNVQAEIRELKSSPNGYTLDDVCFKPGLLEDACVVQSVLAWYGGNLDEYDEDTWVEHFETCASSPGDLSCLPDFQQPLPPHYILGGVPTDEEGTNKYLDAKAMVVTYVVSDSLDPEVQARALEWEEALKDYLVQLSEEAPKAAGLEISFSTGVSLEEEINKSTNMDVKIVVLSYLAMFLYVSLTLGSGSSGSDEESLGSALLTWARNFPRLFTRSGISSSSLSVDSRSVPRWLPRLPTSLFTGSKFTLGLFGISLVILSVSSSVGFFSACGVKVTLIIAEVIPFLVLAVGVDNVFILVHELDRQNILHGPNAAAPASFPPSGYGGASNGNNNYNTMSPANSHHRSPFDSSGADDIDVASMPLYFSAEERVARTLAKMGPSILLSTITETTAFALGALVPMPAVRNFALYAAGSVFLNAVLQVTVFVSAMLIDLKRLEANRIDCFPCIRLPTRIALMDAPPSGSGVVVVLLIFSGIFVASVIMMQYIELGLDQRLALPSDSYLVDYFNKMDEYLNVGPPVYFVVREANVEHRAGQRAICGRFTTCEEFSVASTLEAERQRSQYSYISEPSASWIDDFFMWLNPLNENCCRVRKDDPSVFCGPRDPSRRCQPCYQDKEPAWNVTLTGLPEDEEFVNYLKQWLSSSPSEDCPLAGKAAFGTAVAIDGQENKVSASHFRTFHSPLKNQADFINSFAAAHRVANDISERTGLDVFPYSLHYVFFDQYAHIIAITQEVLGLGLASVLIVTALLLGSWRTGTIVTAVVGLTVVTVMGVMAIWGIDLNAISLVNLVISLGIAVEFCAHVARAFMNAGSGLPVDHPAGQKERDERMWTALVDVGPSVLSGITFTKLIGMCVLALTRSRLLEIYYFRMWLTLIISGALHGLILLPVILSIAGGPGFPVSEADEEWMSNAIRNDYEYAPFLADDDSVASD